MAKKKRRPAGPCVQTGATFAFALGDPPSPELTLQLRGMPDEALLAEALHAREAHQPERAIFCLQEALRRDRSDPFLILELAGCHRLTRDHARMDECIRRAQLLSQDDPEASLHIGHGLLALGEMEAARSVFDELVRKRCEPRAAARVGLAMALDRLNQTEPFAEAVEKAAALAPGDPRVAWLQARRLRRSAPARALEHLREAISKGGDPVLLRDCLYEQATLLDKLEQPTAAMTALTQAKALQSRTPQAGKARAERRMLGHWRENAANEVTAAQLARWHGESPDDAPASAFLLGHPRSGTTLLEQVLDAHPALHSAEETPVFHTTIAQPLGQEFLSRGADTGYGAYLDGLSAGRVAALRAEYFIQMSRELQAPLPGKLLLDKHPALTGNLATIARVLPTAKLIVALRDPRDVCLSAYFQCAELTSWSLHWLTLEETAAQYVRVMEGWLRLREKLAQPWIELRYEDAVDDLEKAGRRMTGFLGLEWHPAQSDPARHARGKVIRSPSRDQVTEPVHARAVGRWRRYEAFLAPVLPVLAPLVREFGYE